MSETKVVACPSCDQKNRVRVDATGIPQCGNCGEALPWLVETGSADFGSVVGKSPIPVLIDFWAPWCGPCRIVEPGVELMSRELAGKLKVAKVNTDEEPALSERFEVRGIPMLVIMDRGKEVDRMTGALNPNALRSWVQGRLGSPKGSAQG